MSDYVLFQMWGPYRSLLIEQHEFYVREARSRLLSRFENIEADADNAAEEWLAESDKWFGPDDDPGSFYEEAYDVSIQHYQMLSDMREQTRLSVVAGMYHQWDKQLRDWLVSEIRHWHHGDHVRDKVWGADFASIIDLLESFGWPIRTTQYFKSLDECRLVVNVYKHGDGGALNALKQQHPQYLPDPLAGARGRPFDVSSRDHTDLRVDDQQFQAFVDAMPAFWRAVPESVVCSNIEVVPTWFEKAILKDRKAIRQKRNQCP